MGKYNICINCKIAFDKNSKICPNCGREIKDESKQRSLDNEGTGRKFRTGGDACDYCPHCYGNENWCPVMDD